MVVDTISEQKNWNRMTTPVAAVRRKLHRILDQLKTKRFYERTEPSGFSNRTS